MYGTKMLIAGIIYSFIPFSLQTRYDRHEILLFSCYRCPTLPLLV